MKRHIVYITTDANRLYLEAGYCQDITLKLLEIQSAGTSFMLKGPKFTRIVHIEEFDNYDLAIRRTIELNQYTRMQKEKLIRRNNPNWLGLNSYEHMPNKKAAVYA